MNIAKLYSNNIAPITKNEISETVSSVSTEITPGRPNDPNG
jgi:hypothetical protein